MQHAISRRRADTCLLTVRRIQALCVQTKEFIEETPRYAQYRRQNSKTLRKTPQLLGCRIGRLVTTRWKATGGLIVLMTHENCDGSVLRALMMQTGVTVAAGMEGGSLWVSQHWPPWGSFCTKQTREPAQHLCSKTSLLQ